MTPSQYKETECCKCGVSIMVRDNDFTPDQNYCMSCAYSKLGVVRIPNAPEGHGAYDD